MNIFGDEFYQLYEENKEHEFFVDYVIDLGDERFSVVEFSPVNSILNNCYKIAVEKSKYTMDEGQNLEIRERRKKIINQFKGIMAETAIHIFLNRKCGLPIDTIHRWDLERSSFADTRNEYDIKITQSGEEFFIESRSSSSYKTDLRRFMMYYDIIGKYSNQKKNNERVSDMYVRPVFQYIDCVMTQEEYEVAIYDTFSDISNNRLKLYLVATAGKKEMYGESGYSKNMGQGGTQYQCIKIKDAHDIMQTLTIYLNEMRERGIL